MAAVGHCDTRHHPGLDRPGDLARVFRFDTTERKPFVVFAETVHAKLEWLQARSIFLLDSRPIFIFLYCGCTDTALCNYLAPTPYSTHAVRVPQIVHRHGRMAAGMAATAPWSPVLCRVLRWVC